MTDGPEKPERRLTAGERNELRRQERRAARRTEGTTPEVRGGQSRTGQARTGQARTGQARTGQARTGQAPAGQARSGQARTGQGRAGQDRTGQGGSGQARTGQGRAGQDRTGQGGIGQGRASGQGRGTAQSGGGGQQRARPTTASAAPARTAEKRDVSAPATPPVTARKNRHREAAREAVRDDVYRAGFACFVGRPNAGKSTLTNAIIGQKIAITSSKPQTTRHVIRGILHRENSQLVLVDTPGLHRPRTLLGQRLNDLVREVWSEVDLIGICFPADEPVGRGDRFISAEMAELKATVIAVVTKVDLVGPQKLAEHLLAVSELYDFAEIVPVSAVSGHQVQQLVDVMIKHMPESPQLYPDDVLTDEPEQVLIAELIREAALEGVRDELPHSIAVLVEEMMVEGGLTKIYADLYVERDSQKSIVIGAKGVRLKEVGTRARAEIENLIGTRVYLDLHVRVAKEWQRDPRQLRKLGF